MASIESRGKNKYRVIVSGGVGLDGKYKRHTKTIEATSATMAKRIAAKWEADILSNNYTKPDKMTFEGLVNQWREAGNHGLSPRVFETYNSIIDGRLIPAMGKAKLAEIRPVQLEQFTNTLKRVDGRPGDLSANTKLNIHKVLSNLFKWASRLQLLSGDNPMDSVLRPKLDNRNKRTAAYSVEEVNRLLSCLSSEKPHWRVLIQTALTTGMRRGEMLALVWGDINTEDGAITVEKSLSHTRGSKVFVKSTKTGHSRTVSVPLFVLTELKALRIIASQRCSDLGRSLEDFPVFTVRGEGVYLHPQSVRDFWVAFLKRHGLPRIRFHDARHTAATILLQQGHKVRDVAEILGHSNAALTMRVYAHAMPDAHSNASATMGELFNTEGLGKK